MLASKTRSEKERRRGSDHKDTPTYIVYIVLTRYQTCGSASSKIDHSKKPMENTSDHMLPIMPISRCTACFEAVITISVL